MNILSKLNEIPPRFFVQNDNFSSYVDYYLDYQNYLNDYNENQSQQPFNLIIPMTQILLFLDESEEKSLFSAALQEILKQQELFDQQQIEDEIALQESGAAALKTMVNGYENNSIQNSPVNSLEFKDLTNFKTDIFSEEIEIMKQNDKLESELVQKLAQLQQLKSVNRKYYKYILQVIMVIYLSYVIVAW